MNWVLMIALTTGGWWGGHRTEFATQEECVSYLKLYKQTAKENGATVVAQCIHKENL